MTAQDLPHLPDGAHLAGPVVGLETATILGPCVLGHPAAGASGPLVLGGGVTIRAYAVLYAGTELGAGVHVGHGALVREGNIVGPGSSIGTHAQLEPGNRLGARCRIHSGCFLSSTTLGDDVFCGPHVVFTDDPHPPCPDYLRCVGGAHVGDRASIGAGTVVGPGVRIGDRALIGAGSTVVHDVAEATVAAGNPARRLRARSELTCGAGLHAAPYDWEPTPAGAGSPTPVEMRATTSEPEQQRRRS